MAEMKTRRRGRVGAFEKRLEEAGGEVLEAWRTRARRRDRVGDLSYQGLQMVHGSAKLAARALGRLEEATQPPHRAARLEPPPAHPEPHAAGHAPAAKPPARHRTAHPPAEPEGSVS